MIYLGRLNRAGLLWSCVGQWAAVWHYLGQIIARGGQPCGLVGWECNQNGEVCVTYCTQE